MTFAARQILPLLTGNSGGRCHHVPKPDPEDPGHKPLVQEFPVFLRPAGNAIQNDLTTPQFRWWNSQRGSLPLC